MGADTFYQTGEGKGALDAFNRAHDDAAYEYGHGGYTGTLAEKGDFIDFTQRATTLGASPATRRKLAEWAYSSHFAYEEDGKKRIKGYVRIPVRATNTMFGVSGPAEMLVPVKVPQRYRQLVADMSAQTDDKWGPAGCIEVGREKGMKRGYRRYIFFGWASS